MDTQVINNAMVAFWVAFGNTCLSMPTWYLFVRWQSESWMPGAKWSPVKALKISFTTIMIVGIFQLAWPYCVWDRNVEWGILMGFLASNIVGYIFGALNALRHVEAKLARTKSANPNSAK